MFCNSKVFDLISFFHPNCPYSPVSNEGAGERGGAESGTDGQFWASVSEVISPATSDSDFLFKELMADFPWIRVKKRLTA